MGLYPQAVVEGPRYTPLFCEENIWQLAQRQVAQGVDAASLQVIMISNRQRQVALWSQRRAGKAGYVVWDYHVVLRRHDGELDLIYDFDTRLAMPCPSSDYFSATFGVQRAVAAPFQATLRLIPADEYLYRFSSDREHMRGFIYDEAYPPWPMITPGHGGVIRLDEYWSMGRIRDSVSRLVEANIFMQTELRRDPGDEVIERDTGE